MADFTLEGAQQRAPLRAGNVVNAAGAIVSLGLIVGVGVWGYNLVMRDISGVPVVRAMEGPMRMVPDNPGGEVADHTGLAVNVVAAQGQAAPPEDTVMLAPATTGLAAEDMVVMPEAEATEVSPSEQITEAAPLAEPDTAIDVAAVAPSEAPLTAEQILALADQIAAGAEPLTDLEEGATPPVQTAVNGVPSAVIADIVPSTVPGVAVSLRPVTRPAGLVVASAPAASSDPAAPIAPVDPTVLVSTATIPVGTSLAQLGAYDSPEIAAEEWRRFNGRFTDYLAGKERLIQEASRGGRTFYRLRAMGFEDVADARRFCAALVAENTDCVPVVVR
ncbi:SPOR domain-containing protein [Loktanella sp. IMCC34160]|uniref:SPOR domain-containing protein n=1 Tax=Loktanella sp. IMCC34160 TaxID=2510646 RepID=UPI00101C7E20|nr:SPOR domain-containing protein [Loktanella sp. IMCC34160]RYG92318.1 SPOR domain-containing protein [Loktanella sp. IMCC34160]